LTVVQDVFSPFVTAAIVSDIYKYIVLSVLSIVIMTNQSLLLNELRTKLT